MNFARVILVMLALLANGLGCQGHRNSTNSVASVQSDRFSVHDRTLQPEIARDSVARARGLQNRMPPKDGLILLFPMQEKHSIWMPNCPEPLEAWVISDQGTILEILDLPAEPPQAKGEADWQYHARLSRHRPRHRARILWEFQAGTAEDWGVTPGDTINGNWAGLLDTDR
ncbi:MAG: DUF192 domain-containing protein [Planctomycetota bacterium]|nr:DUF192 domain-containing protein [Planctomycetota bacterium]